MSVEDAKAKLDRTEGDPLEGWVAVEDVQASYDDLESAWLGDIAESGGAGDGIFATDVRVQKTTPLVLASGNGISSFVAISNNHVAMLQLDGAVGQEKTILLFSKGSLRWNLLSSGTAEPGANSGSNFELKAHADNGAPLRTDLSINRASGKWTIGAVGAAAGIELGVSGPRVMSGTGSPQSVVSAPVGSEWTDTAATGGILKWIKTSGTGSTGWSVLFEIPAEEDLTEPEVEPEPESPGEG